MTTIAKLERKVATVETDLAIEKRSNEALFEQKLVLERRVNDMMKEIPREDVGLFKKAFSVHHFSEKDSPSKMRILECITLPQMESDNESATSKTTEGCEMNLRDTMAQFQSNPNPIRMRQLNLKAPQEASFRTNISRLSFDGTSNFE